MIDANIISRNWASRPLDERYVSLYDMQRDMRAAKANSKTPTVSVGRMHVMAERGQVKLYGPGGHPVDMTHWGFGQLCSEIGASASYLRKLPADLAAPCIDYGLRQVNEGVTSEENERKAMVLLTRGTDGYATLRGLTSPTYGRIWNSDVLDELIPYVGDGVSGQWRVPGEFGKRVEVTRANTTLYASDRDMILMLADEERRVEVPGRRNGASGSMARGVIIGNSEVGASTAFIAYFLFDYVCCNRIIWGMQQVSELAIRHTARGPARWLAEAMPKVETYARSSTHGLENTLANARKMLVEEPKQFLTAKFDFSKREAQLIDLAHRADEGREMRTVWDLVTGVTAYAREIPHQNERMKVERIGGRILQLAA